MCEYVGGKQIITLLWGQYMGKRDVLTIQWAQGVMSVTAWEHSYLPGCPQLSPYQVIVTPSDVLVTMLRPPG